MQQDELREHRMAPLERMSSGSLVVDGFRGDVNGLHYIVMTEQMLPQPSRAAPERRRPGRATDEEVRRMTQRAIAESVARQSAGRAHPRGSIVGGAVAGLRASEVLRRIQSGGESLSRKVIESSGFRAAESEQTAERGKEETASLAQVETEERVRGKQEIAESVRRIERDLKIADARARLEAGTLNSGAGGGFSETDEAVAERADLRRRLAATLEGRAWHRQFTRLESGDTLVCVMTPSSMDQFGMKSLNDDLVWRTEADNHIDARRAICRAVFAGLTFSVRELEQGYKDGYFKIGHADLAAAEANAFGGASGILSRLREALNEINHRVQNDLLLRLRNARGASLTAERAHLLDAAIAEIGAYRLTLGASHVGAAERNGDYTHIERAVLESQKAAQLARAPGAEARAYAPEEISPLLDEIASLRTRLNSGEEIYDAEGRAFPLFIPNVDGSELNLALIREVRKRTFHASPGYEPLLHDIERYLSLINILDPGKKPFTHEEIAGLAPIGVTGRLLKDQLALTERLVTLLRSDADISEAEARAIREEITREGHDRSVTSRIEFTRQALALPDAAYVTLDVLDVGPRQLVQFDRALAEISGAAKTNERARSESFNDAAAVAGDEMTRALRDFRARANAAYQHRFHEIHGGDEAAAPIPPMAVGGDEATIVVAEEMASHAFILELQRKTDARVTKNVIGISPRTPEAGVSQRKRAHIEALARSEAAAERAKAIEKFERRIRADLNDLGAAERGPIESQLNAMRLSAPTERGRRSAFAVVERPDGAYDLLRAGADGGEEIVDANEVAAQLHVIEEELAMHIRRACTRLMNDERLKEFHLSLRSARLALRFLTMNALRETHPAFLAFLHCMG